MVESKAMQRSRGGMVEREEKSDCGEEDMKYWDTGFVSGMCRSQK